LEPLQPVVDENSDPLAAPDAVGPERSCNPASAVGEITVAGRPFAADYGGAAREALGLLAKKLEQRAAIRGLHVPVDSEAAVLSK